MAITRHSRAAWKALDPVDPHTRVDAPGGMTVHWLGGRDGVGVMKHASCAGMVRAVQRHHMHVNGWDDIAYSEAVCQHGHRYEGRGYHHKIGANGSNTGNATRYAVLALVGPGDPVTDKLIEGIAAVVSDYQRHGGAGPVVDCHHDWTSTQCCGPKLTELVRAGAFSTDPAAPPAPRPKPSTTAGEWPSSWTLNRGDKGSRVSQLQQGLMAVFPLYARNIGDSRGRPDGRFGPKTEAAVREFQRRAGLAVDGRVGPATTRALRRYGINLTGPKGWK